MPAAAAITGLAAEARLARRAGLVAVATGGDPVAVRMAAERLAARGAAALVSFGIAGGLDPALASGALLLPEAVRSEDGGRWPVDAGWRARVAAALAAAGLAAAAGDTLGARTAVASAAAKGALFRRHGAAAVDLESHIVAEAAARSGLSFLVLRAVADPAARGLPPAAAVGLDRDGHAALGPVLLSLARRPGQIPDLVRVAWDTRHALTALRHGVPALAGSWR